MIGAIRDGISLCLAEFFPECDIYGDARVQQGLRTPSFFVGMGECSQKPLPNGMLSLRQTVEVVYFPEHHGDLIKTWDVGMETIALLRELRLPDGTLIRGINCRCVVQDDAMHVYAMYHMRLRAAEERGIMEELFQKTMI